MHPSRSVHLTGRRTLVATLLSIAAAAGCRDTTAPGVEARVASVGLRAYDQAIVDSPYVVPVQVSDAHGTALAGVTVHWIVPTNAGVDSVVSYTDASGRSTITWRPPTRAGTYQILATAGALTGTGSIDVLPGAPASLLGLPDSIRFTRMDGFNRFAVSLLDKYGNRLSQWQPALQLAVTGPFHTAFIDADSISIGGSRFETGTGDFVIRASSHWDPAQPVLARVKLVMDPVVARVDIAVGGVDSVSGLSVGEVDTLLVNVTDSSGITIPGIDLAKLGVAFASSNESIATISPTGVITGVGAGTVTISAAFDTTSYSVSFRVGEFSIYDFGAVRKLYDRPLQQSYLFVEPISIDAAGSSLLTWNSYDRPTGAGVTMHVGWFDPNGKARLSHDYRVGGTGQPGAASLAPDGGLYVSYPAVTPLVALDADGAERWRVSAGGIPVGAAGGVYVYRGATLRALSLDGKERWSHDVGAPIAQVVETPALVLVRTFPSSASETAGGLVALSLAGDQLWARAIPNASGIVDAASTYYVASPNGGVQAIDNAGNTLWTTSGSGIGSLALGPGQSIIVAQRYRMSALDRATGDTLWSVSTPLRETPGMDVVDGKVYRFANYLYVWDATAGASLGRSAQRWSMHEGRCTSAGAVFVSGLTVYRYDHC